jgi:asparagine synthase (glutamine-hydrolysing)
MHIWNPAVRSEILSQEFVSAYGSPDNYLPDKMKGADNTNRAMMCDMQSYLTEDIIVKMERASMAHSIEGRSPLLDYRVIELGASLPSKWKVQGDKGKVILRDAFKDMLDPYVADRQKRGFAIPIGEWFAGPLHSFLLSYLNSNTFTSRGIFNKDGVNKYINQNKDRYTDHGHRLWLLLSLELWFRMYIDSDDFMYCADNITLRRQT